MVLIFYETENTLGNLPTYLEILISTHSIYIKSTIYLTEVKKNSYQYESLISY